MILWRMKLRNIRETTLELWNAFRTDPLGSLRFMFQLPLLLLLGLLSRSPPSPPDAATMARDKEQENEYLVFQRRIGQLPTHLLNFSEYFGAPKFSEGEVKEILSTPLAKKMIRDCPHTRKLIPYDLFPERFSLLMRDIPMYLDDMIHTKVLHRDSRIVFSREKKCVGVSFPSAWNAHEVINRYLEWEFQRDGGDPRINAALWAWLFDLLVERPFVFSGFEAEREGTHLVLVRSFHIPAPRLHAHDEERERLDRLRWETPRRPPVVRG